MSTKTVTSFYLVFPIPECLTDYFRNFTIVFADLADTFEINKMKRKMCFSQNDELVKSEKEIVEKRGRLFSIFKLSAYHLQPAAQPYAYLMLCPPIISFLFTEFNAAPCRRESLRYNKRYLYPVCNMSYARGSHACDK